MNTNKGWMTVFGFAIFALVLLLYIHYDGRYLVASGFGRLSAQLRTSRYSSYNVQSNPSNSTKVVCMIFTTPNKWDSRGRAVQNTWAKRCSIPIFFYSRESAKPTNNVSHPITRANNTVALDVPEGRHHLTGKTMAAFRYSFETYGNETDWFLKADDDTYVIWENMILLLSEHNPSVPTYLGRLISNHIPHGYASGGGGYLVSKPGVGLMVTEGVKYPQACHQDGGLEDLDIGRCLEKFGVYPSKTMGEDGKLRMHSDNPLALLEGDSTLLKFYYFTWEEGDVKIGNQARKAADHVLSKDSVSFHYVTPGQMYMFDFLLYKLRRPTSSVNSQSSHVKR